jgi:hypothetical protein
MDQSNESSSGMKKALKYSLAAAGIAGPMALLLGFLGQSRSIYQQSVGHEATLSARGLKGGFGDNIDIGLGPLEQMALMENTSQSAGLSGDKARGAANMSGAFGRAMGVDPNSVAGMYGTMYGASGNASYGSGAIGMMGEAIRKGMDKAKTTELMTLISRNTQITASAMHGAGTGNLAGASTALAIEAIMAQQNGASYGQFAKSQEFAGVMQNGLQGAGTGAGDIRLFSAMGGFDGPMTWEKIHEMNVMKQGGFLKSPELMSKIMGGLTGTDASKAGQLETMFESWGLKGVSSEKMIEMHKGGFFDRLSSATKNGKRSIESLRSGSKEERAVYEEYKKNAFDLGDPMSKMQKEAELEQAKLQAGEKLNEAMLQLERTMIRLTTDVLSTQAMDNIIKSFQYLVNAVYDVVSFVENPTKHAANKAKNSAVNILSRPLEALQNIPAINSYRERIYGKSRSVRNNNPGNLKYSSDAAAIRAGATGC